MATPEMRPRTPQSERPEKVAHPLRAPRGRAFMRLLGVERSEEIFPVLLEEIVAAGYARAFVVGLDFESGMVAPVASLNCSRPFLARFRASLFATDNPLIGVLHAMRPAVLPGAGVGGKALSCHPMVFRNAHPCWEAEAGVRRSGCLAVLNYERRQRLQMNEQVCSTCDMRSYAALLAVELKSNTTERDLSELRSMVELANRYLTRLFKVEHYYNRMTDMETTIAQMQTVLRSMTDPVVLTDNHHRVIMQNQAAERFFKLPEQGTEGRSRAVELNNLLFSAALSSMAVAGGDATRDLTLVDAIEGEELLFEAVCAPTYGRDGQRTGMVTVLRDVTDLRRADEELRANYDRLRRAEEVVRQQRDRLNLVIENVGDPIVVCDNAAKIVLLDPLATELFGAQGHRVADPKILRNQARLDAYITPFTFSFSDRESGPLRIWNPSTHAELEYDARSGKIYDERGQVAYTVTVLRDLTALRKVEELKLERRMLEIEKFAAAGRLAGTIAHEVNNPLEAIKNCIYLLAGGVNPDREQVYHILKGETERVARIVRQMLGLYRNTEAVGTVDVNTVLEDTLLLFSRQLERVGVKLTVKLGDLPTATGSSDQLRQVFSNLVVNAKDAMPQGGELRIRSRLISSADGVHSWIRVLIADTGTGIPRKMLRSIFEPFVTTKGEKGTGLGLWIVRGIIENHGGKIRVRSVEGRGTVFKIDLPVVR